MRADHTRNRLITGHPGNSLPQARHVL